jgi:cellulose synthase operon protein C
MWCRAHAGWLVGPIFSVAVLTFGLFPATGQAKDAQAYVESARTYIAKGNLKAAELELRNAARQAPDDARIRAMLAQVYLGLGQVVLAEREARSAKDRNAAEADYLLVWANAMLRQGKFADVVQQIKHRTFDGSLGAAGSRQS